MTGATHEMLHGDSGAVAIGGGLRRGKLALAVLAMGGIGGGGGVDEDRGPFVWGMFVHDPPLMQPALTMAGLGSKLGGGLEENGAHEEEEEDVITSVARNFGVWGGARHARAKRLASNKGRMQQIGAIEEEGGRALMRFEALGRKFVLQLREHGTVISDLSKARIHGDQAIQNSHSISGGVYIGERLAVEEEEEQEEKGQGGERKEKKVYMENEKETYIDAHAHVSSNNGTIHDPDWNGMNSTHRAVPKQRVSPSQKVAVRVIDKPFGRFYLERGPGHQMYVNGGFVLDDQLIRVQNVLPRRKKSLGLDGSSSLLLTVQPWGGEDKTQVGLKKQREKASPSSSSADHLDETNSQKKKKKSYRCGHDNLPFNQNPFGAASFMAKAMVANSNRLHARAQSQCPTQTKVLYVGVVADCAYVRAFGGDRSKTQANIIGEFNMASAIYERAFNIRLGILSIDLMSECTTIGNANGGNSKGNSSDANTSANSTMYMPWNVPCSRGLTMEERLSMFARWRDTQPADAGIYHLVSGCSDSDVVGIAWLNQVCQSRSFVDVNDDWVSGVSISALIRNQFAVIAHEIGHNLGAVHDCDAATCSNCQGSDCQCCPCGKACDCFSRFIMNPESGGLGVHDFSPCTKQDVCHKMSVLAAPCLHDLGSKRTIGASICGNGIREEGEECDCGGELNCAKTKCCTTECKLADHATCYDGNDLCCRDCQIIPASEQHVCRESDGLCQHNSICNGTSPICPATSIVADGTPCDQEGGTCASGQCTTRARQCVAVGARLGLSEDCSYEIGSCNIVCQSSVGPGAAMGRRATGCVMLDASFINGTPCGYSGHCYDGLCSEPAYKTFVVRNAIPLGILIGIMVFPLIFFILSRLNRLRRGRG